MKYLGKMEISMTEKNKMTFNRPDLPAFRDPSEFVNAVGKTDDEIKEDKKINAILPWKEKEVREDHMVGYNVRIPEPYYRKLVWLSNQSRLDKKQNPIKKRGNSLHSFLIEGVKEHIDKKIKKRLKEIGREDHE